MTLLMLHRCFVLCGCMWRGGGDGGAERLFACKCIITEVHTSMYAVLGGMAVVWCTVERGKYM